MKTIVYVDGFNLSYFLKRKPSYRKYRWLDVFRLAQNMLGTDYDITQVNYYTAPVIGDEEWEIQEARRQKIYWQALETRPEVKIHEGVFTTPEKYGELLTDDKHYKSPLPPLPPSLPSVLKFRTREEKKTDVNLASHLVRDAFCNRFEVAVVITNDGDFEEAIRLVKQEAKLPIWLLPPVKRDSGKLGPQVDLLEIVTPDFIKRVKERNLANAQLPQQIPGTRIARPSEWG